MLPIIIYAYYSPGSVLLSTGRRRSSRSNIYECYDIQSVLPRDDTSGASRAEMEENPAKSVVSLSIIKRFDDIDFLMR